MPFQSDAQRKYMYANHPEIAKRWTMEYHQMPDGTKMPGKTHPTKKSPRKLSKEQSQRAAQLLAKRKGNGSK